MPNSNPVGPQLCFEPAVVNNELLSGWKVQYEHSDRCVRRMGVHKVEASFVVLKLHIHSCSPNVHKVSLHSVKTTAACQSCGFAAEVAPYSEFPFCGAECLRVNRAATPCYSYPNHEEWTQQDPNARNNVLKNHRLRNTGCKKKCKQKLLKLHMTVSGWHVGPKPPNDQTLFELQVINKTSKYKGSRFSRPHLSALTKVNPSLCLA